MSTINIEHGLEGALPADLSKLVEKSTLMRMAFEAVEATLWPMPRQAEADRTPEPVLRTLLGFCYMTGVFSSREISTLAKQDVNIRYLCANDYPETEVVRQFRRLNISCLRETLARMVHAICLELGWTTESTSYLPYLIEADRRLRLAVEADSAAMDDWAS